MSAAIEYAVALHAMVCGECGITFGAPERWVRQRREEGGTFYCPNGHARVFREPEVEKLKRQLAEKEAAVERAKQGAAEASKRAERNWKTLRQTQGKLNAVKKRVGNGVCPCCNRAFSNLARHMHTKHPEFQQPTDIQPAGDGR